MPDLDILLCTANRPAERPKRPHRTTSPLPILLEDPKTPTLIAADSEIEKHPVEIPKRCACGCHISASGRAPGMVAVSVTREGTLDIGLGYLSSEGCADRLLRDRRSLNRRTAILHPSRVREVMRETPAQPIVDASVGVVRSQYAHRYRIA